MSLGGGGGGGAGGGGGGGGGVGSRVPPPCMKKNTGTPVTSIDRVLGHSFGCLAGETTSIFSRFRILY